MKKGIIFLFSTIFIFDLIKEQHLCHGKIKRIDYSRLIKIF